MFDLSKQNFHLNNRCDYSNESSNASLVRNSELFGVNVDISGNDYNRPKCKLYTHTEYQVIFKVLFKNIF